MLYGIVTHFEKLVLDSILKLVRNRKRISLKLNSFGKEDYRESGHMIKKTFDIFGFLFKEF